MHWSRTWTIIECCPSTYSLIPSLPQFLVRHICMISICRTCRLDLFVFICKSNSITDLIAHIIGLSSLNSFHEYRKIWIVAFMRFENNNGRTCGFDPHICGLTKKTAAFAEKTNAYVKHDPLMRLKRFGLVRS